MKQVETNKYNFTFTDIFAGIGGFHEALKPFGGKSVAACEIDERARSTYLANHNIPSNHFYKDVRDLDYNIVPDHDLLCAGFPCQPFSISGKQAALKDKRSKVIDSLLSLIEIKKPKMIVLENVKHIKHVNKGIVFNYIIDSLRALNYKVSYKLLNAKDFAVPQNRERWIFIGVLGDQAFRFNLSKKPVVPLKEIIDAQGDFFFLEEPYTLLNNPKKQPSGLIFCGYRNKKIRKSGVRNGTEHLSRVHKQPNRIYSIEGIHPTIPSQESSGRFWVKLSDNRVRKLTILECFRIMGFRDSFIKPVSDGNLYKQIGNSVCIPMIREVLKELLRHMRYLSVAKDKALKYEHRAVWNELCSNL